MADEPRDAQLTPLAESDLEDIWLYTRDTWSVQQAENYVGEIVETIEQLCAGTQRGRAVDVREGYLKFAVRAHMIYYRLSEPTLEVIRILHQRMDVGRYL